MLPCFRYRLLNEVSYTRSQKRISCAAGPVLFLQNIRGSNSSECLSEYRLCFSISRRQRLDVPCPCSSSKLIQCGHLWCFSITALLALTGFTSTQCASVTIVHDLNVGEVILDCSIWFPLDSLLNRHAQKHRRWTTASVWACPFTSLTEMAGLVHRK